MVQYGNHLEYKCKENTAAIGVNDTALVFQISLMNVCFSWISFSTGAVFYNIFVQGLVNHFDHKVIPFYHKNISKEMHPIPFLCECCLECLSTVIIIHVLAQK